MYSQRLPLFLQEESGGLHHTSILILPSSHAIQQLPTDLSRNSKDLTYTNSVLQSQAKEARQEYFFCQQTRQRQCTCIVFQDSKRAQSN